MMSGWLGEADGDGMLRPRSHLARVWFFWGSIRLIFVGSKKAKRRPAVDG